MNTPIKLITILFLLIASTSFSADFTVNTGTMIITWDAPEDVSNPKGYRLVITDDFLYYGKTYIGITPPDKVEIAYQKSRIIVLKVYSIDLTGKLGGYAECTVELIASNTNAKGLSVE